MSESVRLVSLCDLVEERAERIAARKDPSLPYIGLEHVAQGEPTILGSERSDSSISANAVFEAGDILFGKLRPNLHKSVQAPYKGYCSTDILVFRARPGIDPSFAARVFQWSAVFDEAVRTAEGTKMPRTSWDRLKSFRVPLPSPCEQCRIAEILDTIDASIQQTEALIAKLKVMEAGLLYDLLTRGLDEQGRLRDPTEHPEEFKNSALGHVPRSWAVSNLREHVYYQEGPGLRHWQFRDSGVRFLNIRCFKTERLDLDVAQFVSQGDAFGPYKHFLLDQGDLVMSSSGTLGRLVEIGAEHLPLMLNTSTIRFRPDGASVTRRFLWWFLQTDVFFRQISRESQGSAQANFGPSHLAKVMMLIPSMNEQRAILARADVAQERIGLEEDYRDKLRQIKQGLMHDLLTGRSRVGTAVELRGCARADRGANDGKQHGSLA